MRKKTITIIITLFSVFIAVNLSAQNENEWELVFSESEEFIRDICFVPGDDGLWQTGWGITGYPESNIIKTTDGGDTWIEIEQSYSTLLASIWFVNEDTGYICTLQGSDPAGLILKSTDGGLTWFVIRNVEDDSFDKIRFKDELNGFVSGYPSLYTTDGGDTWSDSELPGEWDVYWQVDYAEGDIYYGIELGGEVGKTIDGGANWTLIHSFSPTMLGGIAFYDEMHGLIGGDLSTVAVTHDGGDNWEETTLGDGQRFGMAIGIFDQDIMYAGLDIEEIWMTTDGGETWVLDTVIEDHTYREMFVTPYNVAYIGGTDMTDGGGTVWRRVGEVPLVAAFESSEFSTCAGSTVDFTDLSYYDVVSWDWTFEGGTPATSTDQNPTVTYNSGGVFDVTLTVTNSNGDTQTLTETDFIEVFETPDQAETPDGEENICTSNIYMYTIPEVEFAQSYEWEISPEDVGILTWNDTEATLETSEDWTGEYTIRVRAINFCADGAWSEYFEGSIYLSPQTFALQGGGSYCEGGEGVEVTLDGSQTGVDYQLFVDGEPTGQTVSGTGDPLSFGFLTEAGIYEAMGVDENCETQMSEQVEIIVFELPIPEITGLDMVCDGDITTYETTNNEESNFVWEVNGGIILEGQGTSMMTVEWGDAGEGLVSVIEEDENGCFSELVTMDVLIDNCTVINEIGISNLNLYPNPTEGKLNISVTSELNRSCKLMIYSRIGQLVYSNKLELNTGHQINQIDISKLNSGLYLILIETSDKIIFTSRIIKN